ncbi:MAG: DUF3232 domain-containing protein [Peptococcia bacterium]
MICADSIQELISKNREDAEMLKLIENCLMSFYDYHTRIFKMEIWLKLHDYRNTSKEDFQTTYTELDKSRSICHNALIKNLSILNRLCQQHHLPLVYGGVVSEERPHRIEIADAVLSYVEEIVKQRQK